MPPAVAQFFLDEEEEIREQKRRKAKSDRLFDWKIRAGITPEGFKRLSGERKASKNVSACTGECCIY
jgi:hypothetical protein